MKGDLVVHRKGTLAKRIAFIYFFCIFLPIVAFSIFFISSMGNSMKHEEEENLRISMERARSGLEAAVSSGIQAGNFAAMDTQIQEFISGEYESALAFFRAYSSYVSLVLSRYAGLSDTVEKIMIYTDNPTLLNAAEYRQLDENVRKQEWYKDFIASGRQQLIVSGVDNPGYWDTIRTPYISIVSKEIENNKPLGREFLVRVSLNLESLYHIVDAEKEYFDFYLLNEHKQIVISTGKRHEPITLQELKEYAEIEKSDNTLVFHTAIGTARLMEGWQLVGLADMGNLHQRLRVMCLQVILMAFACMVLSGGLMVVLTYSYTSRIRLLRRSIENVQNRKFEQIHVKRVGDDVGDLIEAFNLMSRRIDTLVNDVHELEIQKKTGKWNKLRRN
ncbi:sensor histidine kinase [Eisenbergiella sp.]